MSKHGGFVSQLSVEGICFVIASLSNGVLDIRHVTPFRPFGTGNMALSSDLWFWLNTVING